MTEESKAGEIVLSAGTTSVTIMEMMRLIDATVRRQPHDDDHQGHLGQVNRLNAQFWSGVTREFIDGTLVARSADRRVPITSIDNLSAAVVTIDDLSAYAGRLGIVVRIAKAVAQAVATPDAALSPAERAKRRRREEKRNDPHATAKRWKAEVDSGDTQQQISDREFVERPYVSQMIKELENSRTAGTVSDRRKASSFDI